MANLWTWMKEYWLEIVIVVGILYALFELYRSRRRSLLHNNDTP